MTTWISLLRGVNVGGKNRLPMQALRASLARAGFTEVRTYIQSGNVVFEADEAKADTVAKRVGQVMADDFSLSPSVICLTAAQLGRAMTRNPFGKDDPDPKTVHFYFLSRVPADPDLPALERKSGPNESFALHGGVFYLHAPDGIARSKLAVSVEQHLGVPATARNLRTVTKLVALARLV